MSIDIHRLYEATVTLGLDRKVLSQEELQRYPVAERVSIVNSVLEKRLAVGRWGDAVEMVYGGSPHITALIDVDKETLREKIVAAAKVHPLPSTFADYDYSHIAGVLHKNHDNTLAYRLATEIPKLTPVGILAFKNAITPEFFSGEEGSTRYNTLEDLAGERSFSSLEYLAAARHFKNSGNNEGIGRAFDAMTEHIGTVESWSDTWRNLEEVALHDPEKKNERLRRIILKIQESASARAFEVYTRHQVHLEDGELETLMALLAQETQGYALPSLLKQTTFFEEGARDKWLLGWAKHHTTSEPGQAYAIFKNQAYDGEEVTTAVATALHEWDRRLSGTTHRREDLLDPRAISRDHLETVYTSTTDFPIRTMIAIRLGDTAKLQALSAEAHAAKNAAEAYSLWVEGQGDLNAEYIQPIRSALLRKAVKEGNPPSFPWFLNKDPVGTAEAYDLVCKKAEKEADGMRWLRCAYGLALNLHDEERLNTIRQKMIATDASDAFSYFNGRGGTEKDERGLEMVIVAVAEQHGVPLQDLQAFVDRVLLKKD